MDRKNKGKEAFDKFSDAVRVLLVDDDKSRHLELARMLQECGCDVVIKCNGAKDALDWLRKDTSRFDIMITERNLPDMELLQKVEQEDLLVIAMSRGDGIEDMQNSTITIHGVLKPITMNFLITLWQHVFRKNIRNPAELQPTNDASNAKRRRFNWSRDLSNKFTNCVEELKKEGIEPTPKKIMERMEAIGVQGLTTAIVKSHNQKWQEKRTKEGSQLDMQGYNDKDDPGSVHVLESLNSATQLPQAPAAMNISSQHHVGAPQIMTQPSSSRQICNDLPGGQAFDDDTSINASTNLLANNLYLYWDFSNTDTFDDIDFKELDNYLSKYDKQIP